MTPPESEAMTDDIHAELAEACACNEAREWAQGKDAATIWATCERGEWLLWWIGKCSRSKPWSDERKPVVLAAIECALLALPIFEKRYPDDRRVRDCLDIFERWAKGEHVPREALLKARHASASAADAAYAASDTYARAKTRRECADIVRHHFPTMPRCIHE